MMQTVGSVELPEAARVNEEPREVLTYEQESGGQITGQVTVTRAARKDSKEVSREPVLR